MSVLQMFYMVNEYEFQSRQQQRLQKKNKKKKTAGEGLFDVLGWPDYFGTVK